MTRLYSRQEPVEVRRRDDVPDQFLWRGRLYVVRAVLSRWTEAGGWWRGAAVRGLTAGEAAPAGRADLQTTPVAPRRKREYLPWGEPAPEVGAVVAPATIDDRERDWWRVEADSGRLAALSGGTGVYDLCFDWSRPADRAWSLARVMD